MQVVSAEDRRRTANAGRYPDGVEEQLIEAEATVREERQPVAEDRPWLALWRRFCPPKVKRLHFGQPAAASRLPARRRRRKRGCRVTKQEFEAKVAAAAAKAGTTATVVSSKPGTGTVTFLKRP